MNRAGKLLLGAIAVVAVVAVIVFWPAVTHLRSTARGTPVTLQSAPPAPASAEWRSFAGSPGGGQYSPLAQIDRSNVTQLQVAWTHHSGDFMRTEGANPGTSLSATPLMAHGKLYYCTPFNRVFALDATTGKELWVADLNALSGTKEKLPMTCRGVAYWETDTPVEGAVCQRRVFKGDGFGRLFALDADTGKLCEDFAADSGHPGWTLAKEFDNGGEGAIFYTSPPAIYRDLVIVGSGVLDNWAASMPDGIVRALDVRTGREAWHFNPIPAELSATSGAANVWSLIAVDAANDVVYLPTTSPSADPVGSTRDRDIPLANAVVALRASTGEKLWHFQAIHHDLFDYDLPAQPILADVPRDGGVRAAIVQTTKMGHTFVLDRATGEPLFPVEERPVPKSDVPGERASPTQPVPTLPEPFARQKITRDDMFGVTLMDRASCRAKFDGLRYDGMYTPPSLKGTLVFPSSLGGGNWGGAAVDPVNHLLVVKAQNLATRVQLVPAAAKRTAGAFIDFLNQPLNGTPYELRGEFLLSSYGVPCTPPPWGELTALDLRTGKTVWRTPIGRVPVGSIETPEAWGSPTVGGPLITAGGLVFIGATMDDRFRAIDLATGRVVWQANVPAPAMAVPMTYTGADGRQYVVVAAGGNSIANTKNISDAIVAYALPKKP